VSGADRRLRLWIAEEPLGIYRDAVPPHPMDVEALRRGLSAEVRTRSLAESEHVAIVTDAMAARADGRIDAVARELDRAAEARAEEATTARRRRLFGQLGLLLLGIAGLLAVTLYVLVLGPVRRLRLAVDRIARGDLGTPVGEGPWPAREIADLASDVDRMRRQIGQATEHLEQEVARKTRSLESTLAERTVALEELGATQDRLVQAEKMAGLGTLASGVAHEFNNLLGGVLACVESARAATTDAAAVEDLDVALRTARRATGLVDALLGVARPGERALAPVDLAGVVSDVVGAAAPEARQRGVRLETDLRTRPVVLGDEGQLHQVALNLVTNALQAVDEGERVVVSVTSDGRAALLEVRDEGPGVPEEDRRRVFEPFFTGRRGGTGLGLFVTYGIVERHGGRIEVGEAPEGGARFTVRIPLAPAAPSRPDGSPAGT
jgi:two-component system NtrC family sensor kinase